MPREIKPRPSRLLARRRMTKEQYERVLPPLRDALLAAQQRLQREKKFALAVIVTGVPTAGRSEIVNQFLEWLDPKHIRVYAMHGDKYLAKGWPLMRRFWNTLPARGQMAFYFMGWYEDYLEPAMFKHAGARRKEARAIERIRQLEKMLPQDGVQVLKMHLEVSEKTQKERIGKLHADKLTRWRVTREERWLVRHHDRVRKTMGRCMQATQQPGAEWNVIDGTDPQSRSFAAGQLLLEQIERGFHKRATPVAKIQPRKSGSGHDFKSHQQGDAVEDDVYDLELERLKGRFALLTRRGRFGRHGAVFAFEGIDAAGKGGAIRRLTSALDARQYNVVPIAAPTAEDLAHPYLWRFWRHVPRSGEIAIFDRSWYGRVLVERVRGYATPADWQRAYDEIREFELQLAERGLIVHKFWLSVGKQEQLRRFRERGGDQLKRFKVDPEDLINRRYYDQYQFAAHEMIQHTDTSYAPWTPIEADDKKYARLKILRTVCEAIERTLD